MGLVHFYVKHFRKQYSEKSQEENFEEKRLKTWSSMLSGLGKAKALDEKGLNIILCSPAFPVGLIEI